MPRTILPSYIRRCPVFSFSAPSLRPFFIDLFFPPTHRCFTVNGNRWRSEKRHHGSPRELHVTYHTGWRFVSLCFSFFFFFVQAAALWRLFTLFQRCGENLRRRGDAWVKPPRPSFVRMAFGRWWLSSAPGRREPVHHNTFFSLHLYADRYCCFSTCSTPPECFKCRFLGPRGFGGIFVATQNFLPYVTTQIFKQIWVQVRNKMWMCGGRALTVNLWIAKKKKIAHKLWK